MANGDDRKNIVKRVFSFLIGALLTFAVMSFTVVAKEKAQNEKLTMALDASRFQAGRLLGDAKAQLAAREYEGARTSLATLFDKHPGSEESVAGKVLLAEVEDAKKIDDAKWATAMPAIRRKWQNERMTALRAEAEAERIQMENGLSDQVSKEWENSKGTVRKDWEDSSRP